MLTVSVITSTLTAIATSATAVIAYVAFRSTKRVRVFIDHGENGRCDVLTNNGRKIGMGTHLAGSKFPTFMSLTPELDEFSGQALTAELIKKIEKVVNEYGYCIADKKSKPKPEPLDDIQQVVRVAKIATGEVEPDKPRKWLVSVS